MQKAGAFSQRRALVFVLAKYAQDQAPAQFMGPLLLIFQALLGAMAGKDLAESGQGELALVEGAGKSELQGGQCMVCCQAELVKQGGGVAQYLPVGFNDAAEKCQPVRNRFCKPAGEVVQLGGQLDAAVKQKMR